MHESLFIWIRSIEDRLQIVLLSFLPFTLEGKWNIWDETRMLTSSCLKFPPIHFSSLTLFWNFSSLESSVPWLRGKRLRCAASACGHWDVPSSVTRRRKTCKLTSYKSQVTFKNAGNINLVIQGWAITFMKQLRNLKQCAEKLRREISAV